jgi:hypothetical protein
MNKRKEKQRVANGKPAKLVDSSMAKVYQAGPSEKTENGYRLGDQAFDDLTDVQNDEVGEVRLRLAILHSDPGAELTECSLSIRTRPLSGWTRRRCAAALLSIWFLGAWPYIRISRRCRRRICGVAGSRRSTV